MSHLDIQALRAPATRDRPWTWDEVCADPVLSRLPFQIELDKHGRIIMSPAANWRHATTQGKLCKLLVDRLGGTAANEVAIANPEGTFEPDVAWAPKSFWQIQDKNRADLPSAPPLVIEVLSPSNTEGEMQMKIGAYFAAGAAEVWLVDVDGNARFFDAKGERNNSPLANYDTAGLKLSLAD